MNEHWPGSDCHGDNSKKFLEIYYPYYDCNYAVVEREDQGRKF